MKTIIYILLLLFFTILTINAQTQLPQVPYEKTNYLGLNPIWYETCQDTSFVTNKMDGYNHFRPGFATPLIVGDYIYSSYSINETNSPLFGTYINCRELSTGKLIWQDELSARKSGNYEIVRLIEMDEKNQLIITGQIKKRDFIESDTVSFRENLILFFRVYEASTGELLDFSHRDFEDVEAIRMNTSIYRNSKHSYLIREGEMLRYIDIVDINDTFHLRSILIDNSGKKIGEESMLRFKFSPFFFNLFQLTIDTFINVEVDYSNGTLLFKYISPDLREYASYTTPPTRTKPKFFIALKLSEDKKTILFKYFYRLFVFYSFTELIVYNTKANLVKRATIDNNLNSTFEVLEWENVEDETFTILNQQIIKDENNAWISVMKVSEYDDENGEYIINTFKSANPLRYLAPNLSLSLPSDKYFFQFTDVADLSPFTIDLGAYAISQMLLDGKTLFSPSRTEDVSVSSRIALYPNPTIDGFNLAFDTEYSGTIQVYNVSGQLLLQKAVSHTLTEQIDISILDVGLYVVHCISSDHKRSPATLKLVKM